MLHRAYGTHKKAATRAAMAILAAGVVRFMIHLSL